MNNLEKSKGLYVHVPLCPDRCDYCDFVTQRRTTKQEGELYLAALADELRYHQRVNGLSQVEFDTLYVGGGTPTALTSRELEMLFDTLLSFISVKDDSEITIEVNPNTLSQKKLRVLETNVNRVSLGLQTSNDRILRKINRNHTYDEFLAAYQQLIEAGLFNINVDLMYGLPSQDSLEFKRDVQKLINLHPMHVSLYALKLEQNTPLYNRYVSRQEMLAFPTEDLQAEMYYYAREQLLEHGYEHYELSNFTRPGHYARHNTLYWKRGSYLGIGPGAHSFWGNYRFNNLEKFSDYVKATHKGSSIQENSYVTKEEALTESLFLGLRLTEGVDLDELSQKFHVDVLKLFNSQIIDLEKAGLLTQEGKVIKLTPKGYMLSNLVFMEFIPVLDK